ncbi:hypothetical protein LOC54_10365 [Acetobacter sp. AN02]|uniref:hypothetical protein n=1 Tax=Acetobacter sp. AN02 TaxID=2894186 RepID=UPI00243425DD|nr:hypothetical protein [Acetobacter sp. AN02]MDG6095501.1 hypothetical protein [Acetobacter sp. AN02]
MPQANLMSRHGVYQTIIMQSRCQVIEGRAASATGQDHLRHPSAFSAKTHGKFWSGQDVAELLHLAELTGVLSRIFITLTEQAGCLKRLITDVTHAQSITDIIFPLWKSLFFVLKKSQFFGQFLLKVGAMYLLEQLR